MSNVPFCTNPLEPSPVELNPAAQSTSDAGEHSRGHLTTDSVQRKNTPLMRGCFDYFADALAAVARVSQAGNDKHNPGQPLHWARGKSGDHGDALLRHQMDWDKIELETGEYHAVLVAWRALAQAQELLERVGIGSKPRGARDPGDDA